MDTNRLQNQALKNKTKVVKHVQWTDKNRLLNKYYNKSK